MVIVDDYRLTDRYLKDQGSLLVYSGVRSLFGSAGRSWVIGNQPSGTTAGP